MTRWLMPKRSMRMALAAGGLAMGTMLAAHGETVSSTSTRRVASTSVDPRWQSSLDAFTAADLAHAPKPGGVLFVGSSSIRLWDKLESSFESEPVVIKRGFGGSRLSDSARYLNRLVLPYRPKLVIVYAGDNDLAEGASPQDVLSSFISFVEGVRAELPDTRIAYMSIKPSPLRESLMSAAAETNALIEAYSHTEANLDFIDIYSKMLGPDGKPRADLYGPDSLHLNSAGYDIWKREISAHLKGPSAAPAVEGISAASTHGAAPSR